MKRRNLRLTALVPTSKTHHRLTNPRLPPKKRMSAGAVLQSALLLGKQLVKLVKLDQPLSHPLLSQKLNN
jgi:hypothetical protein